MDDNQKLPVLKLELTSGIFRIKTEEAIYEITVKSEGGLPQIIEKIIEIEKPVEREVIIEKPVIREVIVEKPAPPLSREPAPAPVAHPGPAPAPSSEDTFYKEISAEMYNEIGKLARQLSLSIKTPIDSKDLKSIDITKAGIDLEAAKGQLQDIMKMTEKATMDIMDVSEDIQDSCDVIKNNLTAIKELQFIGKQADGQSSSPPPASSIIELFDRLAANEKQIREALTTLPVKEPEQSAAANDESPATEIVRVYHFDINVVFQTLYELCTNETVKKSHVKPMWDERDAVFDVPEILKAFSEMAPTVPVEETFYNFPLSGILKILYQFSNSDKYKQSIKKMNQSSSTIFLDQIIPIEGTFEENAVAVHKKQKAQAASSGSEQIQSILSLIDENITLLKDESARIRQSGPEPPAGDYARIRQEDHEKLISAIESTDKVIQRIIANIRHILESLTFQDLSGQRIKKILSMLSSVQVQLLTILVSFGAKLKVKQEEKSISAVESDEIAIKEVDKMKSLVAEQAAAGEDEWGGPLNQQAVDNLLEELGF